MIHKNIAKVLLIAAALLSLCALGVFSTSHTDHPYPEEINCSKCHTCDVPTRSEPCLKTCPRTGMVHQTAKHLLAEAPDNMVLDELEDLYLPVHFSHKLHASMAQMGHDCATCHHYSPEGHIPPCKECHGGEENPADLTRPTLMGAYHRQCLSCHREWSHDTKCVICHLPTPGKDMVTPGGFDSTDIIGISHPVITEPVKKVYHTPYEKQPIVTFQHKEHIDLFGFRCVDCHQEENCSYCHDIEKTEESAKSQEEVHAICNDCHIDDACDKCHDTQERPGFSHNQTGWPLGNYHNDLDCWACHPTGKKISKLSKMCHTCHRGWTTENFKHAVTGLKLDEIHADMDCTDCHAEGRYDKDPVCSDCHDDGRTAHTAPPGMKTKMKK